VQGLPQQKGSQAHVCLRFISKAGGGQTVKVSAGSSCGGCHAGSCAGCKH
jgi:hypothetical protein